jgi:hypothetical protein
MPPEPPKKLGIKVHIQLHTPKKPKIKVRIRLQHPKKQEIEAPTPLQSQTGQKFRVILTPFTFLTINAWFLTTCTFPPSLQYLRNLKISRPHDAPLFVWKLHAGVRIRGSIKAAREEFITL